MYITVLKFEDKDYFLISNAPYGVIEEAVDTAKELENDGSLTEEEFDVARVNEIVRKITAGAWDVFAGIDITFWMD